MKIQYLISLWLLAGTLLFHSAAASPAVVAVLILDNSGSMKTSDPANLRYTALDMLAALLDDGDRLGVIGFSTISQALTNGLISPRQYKGIRPSPPEGYTDIKTALVEASKMLASTGTDNKTGVILLTDGKAEIEHPYPEYERETLAQAQLLGVPVYAIALTPQADLAFLNRLAAVTGGAVFPARDASDLLDAYLQAFNAMQDRTVTGAGIVSAPGSVELEIDPALAPYLEKVSFVLGKSEGAQARLTDPGGQSPSANTPNTTITSDPRFLIITIRQPQGGIWKFMTTGAGQVRARAILYSRLRVQIVSPGSIQKTGEPIPIVARLLEQRESGELVKIIGDAAFSAQITRPDGSQESLDRFYDDGTHGDLVANDGDFTRLYGNALLPGTYLINITGRKGAVPVAQESRVQMVDFPTLLVDTPQGNYEIRDQPLLLQAHLAGGRLDSGEVLAHLTAPSGKHSEIRLAGREGAYMADFTPTENGTYSVEFETRNAIFLGVPFWEAARTELSVSLIRTLLIGPPEIQVTSGCLAGNPRITVTLPVSSLRQEHVELFIPGFTLQPAAFTLHPGEQQITFDISPIEQSPMTGDTQAILRLTALPGLQVQPGAELLLNFNVPARLIRCREPLSWGGLGILGVTLVGSLLVRRRRVNQTPARVSGTIRWWNDNQPATEAQECDLTALGSPNLTIGSHPDCDVCISTGELAERHVLLLAEKTENAVAMYLQPISAVKKGYGWLHARVLLAHCDQFCMGGLNFQYLSDSGE